MADCGVGAPQFEFPECRTDEQVEDGLARVDAQGIDLVLVDTKKGELENSKAAALGLAGLVIASATGLFEAQYTVIRVVLKGTGLRMRLKRRTAGAWAHAASARCKRKSPF